ncbi:MAG TPA: PepSY-associated TM helix domain-containing protein [Azoarcus taiwanensis]|nr:PepSY-associated TM helix domain-containing protein [Azoarcus taiwanensis]
MPTYPPPSPARPTQPASPAIFGKSATHDTPIRRAWWLRQMLQWHWISSAICLIGMLLFSVTGITLNHPNAIPATPRVETQVLTLEPDLRQALAQQAGMSDGLAPLPTEIRRWLTREIGRPIPRTDAEWEADEIYLALPRPGGDAWLAIDLDVGTVEYELTRRGSIAWLNDLHKGRNTGPAWSLFIDLFAAASIVFSLTGLFILWMHARQRPLVWPMVGLGALIPLLIIVLFMH